MALRRLIEGETISIDNHHRGAAMDIDDQSIHLHKRFNRNNKRFGNSEVRIDLNRNRQEINVKSTRGANAGTILKEIQEAFADENLRKAFVEDMIQALCNLTLFANDNHYWRLNDIDERGLTKAGADRIMEIIRRVYSYFQGPADELKSLQYDKTNGFIAQFVTFLGVKSRHISILSDRLVNADIPLCQSRYHYVKADLSNTSFSLSSSRKELTSDQHK